jgi:hypothetical protein
MMDQPAAPRAMFAPPGENRLRPMSEIQNLALISASLKQFAIEPTCFTIEPERFKPA